MFNKVDTGAMKLLLVFFLLNVFILKNFAKSLSSEESQEECRKKDKCLSSTGRRKESNVIIVKFPIIYIKPLKKTAGWEEKNSDYHIGENVRNHHFTEVQDTEPKRLLGLLRQTDYNKNIDDVENASLIKSSEINGYQNINHINGSICEEDDNYMPPSSQDTKVESNNDLLKRIDHKDDINGDKMCKIYNENLEKLWFTLSKYLGVRFSGSLPEKRIIHNIVLLINAYLKFIDLKKAKKVSEKETQERRINENSKDFKYEVKKQTSDDSVAKIAFKLKKIIAQGKNMPMHAGKIIEIILPNVKSFILEPDNEPCLNENIEYLITSISEAYQEYFDNICIDDYIKSNKVLKKKIDNLANVVNKVKKNDLSSLLMSIFSIKTNEEVTIKPFSNLSSTTLSEQHLRQLLHHTTRLRLLSEYCEKFAFDRFFDSIKAIIVNVKKRYCNKFYTKAEQTHYDITQNTEDIKQLPDLMEITRPLKQKLTDERNLLQIENVDDHDINNEFIFDKKTPEKKQSDSSIINVSKNEPLTTLKTNSVLKSKTLEQKIQEKKNNRFNFYDEIEKDKIMNLIEQQKLKNPLSFQEQAKDIEDKMNILLKIDTSEKVDVVTERMLSAKPTAVNLDVLQNSSPLITQVVNLKDKLDLVSFLISNENEVRHENNLSQAIQSDFDEVDEKILLPDKSKKYILSPGGKTIITNNFLKPEHIKNLALNQLKLSPPQIYIQLSSSVPGKRSSENVELTYLLNSMKLHLYQPQLFIKHRIPYNYYLHNLNTIIQDETNPKDDELKLLNVVKLLPNNETELLYQTKNQYSTPNTISLGLIVNDSDIETDFLKNELKSASILNSKRFNAENLTAIYFDSIINVTDILDDVENEPFVELSAIRVNGSLNNAEQSEESQVTKRTDEAKSANNHLWTIVNQQAVDESNVKFRPNPANIHGKIMWNSYPISGPKYTYPRPTESRISTNADDLEKSKDIAKSFKMDNSRELNGS